MQRRQQRSPGGGPVIQLWTQPSWPIGQAPEGGIAVEWFHYVGGSALYGLLGGVAAASTAITLDPQFFGTPVNDSCSPWPGMTFGLPSWGAEIVLDELVLLRTSMAIAVAAVHDVYTSEMSLRLTVRRLVALMEPDMDLTTSDLLSAGARPQPET